MADLDALLAGLDTLEQRVMAGLLKGAQAGATDLQTTAQQTSAYIGQSGATRDGTVAYVATALDDGSDAFEGAYQAAAQHLAGFTGHGGNVERQSVGTAGPDEIVIILTVPTDYIKDLETDNGGQKAFIGPTMDGGAVQVTQQIAAAVARELGS